MLGNKPYYHKHLKRYISLFGSIFNDISIVREDKDSLTKTIKVPLSFVNKNKIYNKLIQDPKLENTFNTVFPRMSFEMFAPTYAPYRKQNSVNKITKALPNGKVLVAFSPAPYDINFVLTIFSTYYEDGLQIVEQILPFFQPEFTAKVEELPEFNLLKDIQIVLNSVDLNDVVEGAIEEERIVEWTLDFTLKGYFYGPLEYKNINPDGTTNTGNGGASGNGTVPILHIRVDTIFEPDFKMGSYLAEGVLATRTITESFT
jgi:T4-like virus Myoviridae tail sheath stabiliser